jgi:hypothetical protein
VELTAPFLFAMAVLHRYDVTSDRSPLLHLLILQQEVRMAKKKASKKRAPTAAKKGKAKTAKKGASSGGKKSATTSSKKRAPVARKKAAAALAHTKHTRHRIGLTKNLKINKDATTTFKVYGDSIGSTNPKPPHVKVVVLGAKHHHWDPLADADVQDAGPDALQITATAHPNRTKSLAPFTSDDLTVTITLDPGTIGEDMTDCTFSDVEYLP